jgi:penicillin-binding protein-related factor A (putative recombinase)
MKEKDLNTIINNSFKELGFSHKIADPIGGTGIQNPFDGFSVLQGKQWYWEAKLLKGYQAFNFNKIENHQLESLRLIEDHSCSHTRCLFIVGIWEAYKYTHIYIFDFKYIEEKKFDGKKSILKKDFQDLYERQKAIEVYKSSNGKKLMDTTQLEKKIIV